MTWDQQAFLTAASAHPDHDFDVLRHPYSLSILREHKREAFVDGARWQRSRLRSDESLDRIRAFLHEIVGVETDNETSRELLNALLTWA